MRSLMNTERARLPSRGELALACCACAHFHRIAFTPMVNDAKGELVIDALVRNHDEPTEKLRRQYDWPFQRVTRFKVGRIIGGN